MAVPLYKEVSPGGKMKESKKLGCISYKVGNVIVFSTV